MESTTSKFLYKKKSSPVFIDKDSSWDLVAEAGLEPATFELFGSTGKYTGGASF